MIYAVIDTNVFVAALLTKSDDSATVKVYEAIADGLITGNQKHYPVRDFSLFILLTDVTNNPLPYDFQAYNRRLA